MRTTLDPESSSSPEPGAGPMKERFERIYANNEWRHGSGSGSRVKHTRGYVRMLQRFLGEQAIRSVVDLGCGDWQFSSFIHWDGVQYRGFDLVPSVIEQNRQRFSAPNVEFHLYSGDFAELPAADLLIVKDVLQHWSNEAVAAFLPTLRQYKYSLVTNCVNPHGETANVDIEDGDFRYIDIRGEPFEVEAEEVYSFTNRRPFLLRPFKRVRWRKRVLLVRGD